MANIANFNLDIKEGYITIGRFSVPFTRVTRLDMGPNNTVRVLFEGAMELDQELAIDFQLQTAEKVYEFIDKLLPVLNAHANTYPSDKQPLYTISADRVTKSGAPLPSINGVDGNTFDSTFHVWAEMAGRHNALLPAYMAPIVYFCKMQDAEGAWNDFNFEIFNNLCRNTKDIALNDAQKDDIIAIGNHFLKNSA
jgi:hypothetical protein